MVQVPVLVLVLFEMPRGGMNVLWCLGLIGSYLLFYMYDDLTELMASVFGGGKAIKSNNEADPFGCIFSFVL